MNFLRQKNEAKNEEDRRLASVCKGFGPVSHLLQYALLVTQALKSKAKKKPFGCKQGPIELLGVLDA